MEHLKRLFRSSQGSGILLSVVLLALAIGANRLSKEWKPQPSRVVSGELELGAARDTGFCANPSRYICSNPPGLEEAEQLIKNELEEIVKPMRSSVSMIEESYASIEDGVLHRAGLDSTILLQFAERVKRYVIAAINLQNTWPPEIRTRMAAKVSSIIPITASTIERLPAIYREYAASSIVVGCGQKGEYPNAFVNWATDQPFLYVCPGLVILARHDRGQVSVPERMFIAMAHELSHGLTVDHAAYEGRIVDFDDSEFRRTFEPLRRCADDEFRPALRESGVLPPSPRGLFYHLHTELRRHRRYHQGRLAEYRLSESLRDFLFPATPRLTPPFYYLHVRFGQIEKPFMHEIIADMAGAEAFGLFASEQKMSSQRILAALKGVSFVVCTDPPGRDGIHPLGRLRSDYFFGRSPAVRQAMGCSQYRDNATTCTLQGAVRRGSR